MRLLYSFLIAGLMLSFPSLSHARFRFAPPVFLPAGEQPFFLVAEDYNRDGHTDLAVCNRRSNDVSVFWGDGKGGFPSRLDIPLGEDRWPVGMTAADLNADGALDLITANHEAHTVSVLYGDGRGAFADPIEFHTEGATPEAVVAADFDGDGRLDLAAANRAGHTPVPGDVSILLQKTPGQFTVQEFHLPGRTPRAILAADLNDDGKPDLVTANFLAATLYVFAGAGNGRFASPAVLATKPGPVHIVGADFNEDGRLDIAVANRRTGAGQPGVSVYLGRYGGTFKEPLYLPAGELPAAVAAADLDGDRHADIAVVNGFSDDLMLYQGNGKGEFTGPTTISFAFGVTTPRSLIAIDLDHDGDQDLAIANKDDNTLTILLNEAAKPVGVAVTAAGAAVLEEGAVEIFWTTAAPDVSVFLYRQPGAASMAEARLDASTRVTDSPVSGPGRHRVVDAEARSGGVYTYWLEALETGGNRSVFGPFVVTVVPPDRFELAQNYPNPFNAGTEIAYHLARRGRVTLTVYNLLGAEVVTLVDEEQPAGRHAVRWNGRDGRGAPVGSGIYIYTLRAGTFTATRRMAMVK